MRVLCVGRHAFLSEHLCRVFGNVGALCEPVVGSAAVPRAAGHFEPAAIICEGDLLIPSVLEGWSKDPSLRDVPVLAVTLTPRAHDVVPADLLAGDSAAAIYLPALDRAQLVALLASLRRPPGITPPAEWRVHTDSTSVHHR